MVADLLLKEPSTTSPDLNGNTVSSRDHTPIASRHKPTLADEALDQLVRMIQFSVEVFLRTCEIFNYYFIHKEENLVNLASNDPNLQSDLNREFSALYSIRVQLDRLCSVQEFGEKPRKRKNQVNYFNVD